MEGLQAIPIDKAIEDGYKKNSYYFDKTKGI